MAAEKCRTKISDVSLGAQQVSPGTKNRNITTHVSRRRLECRRPDTTLGPAILNLVPGTSQKWAHIITPTAWRIQGEAGRVCGERNTAPVRICPLPVCQSDMEKVLIVVPSRVGFKSVDPFLQYGGG